MALENGSKCLEVKEAKELEEFTSSGIQTWHLEIAKAKSQLSFLRVQNDNQAFDKSKKTLFSILVLTLTDCDFFRIVFTLK